MISVVTTDLITQLQLVLSSLSSQNCWTSVPALALIFPSQSERTFWLGSTEYPEYKDHNIKTSPLDKPICSDLDSYDSD